MTEISFGTPNSKTKGSLGLPLKISTENPGSTIYSITCCSRSILQNYFALNYSVTEMSLYFCYTVHCNQQSKNQLLFNHTVLTNNICFNSCSTEDWCNFLEVQPWSFAWTSIRIYKDFQLLWPVRKPFKYKKESSKTLFYNAFESLLTLFLILLTEVCGM